MSKPMLVIIKQELRRRRFYLLWWGVGIAALVGLTVLAYGSVKDQAAELNQALGSLSSDIGSFVGTSNMFSPVGYLNSQLYFITLPILFILLSVTLTGSLINKEESHHTMELLLARPISRRQLLLAKAAAGCLIVGCLGAVAAVVAILCGIVVQIDVAAADIALATLWMVLFSGAFGAIAFMLYAASLATRRLAAAIAILFSLGSYVLASLAGMVGGLTWAAKLFPYHYYDPGAVLNGHISGGLAIYLAAIYGIALIVALVGFSRRDIA